MARRLEEQILSFGEISEPHQVVTIAYGAVRIKERDLYSQHLPIDGIRNGIISLQQQALELGGDGVKNITISVVPVIDGDGDRAFDYYAMGTIIKLKR